MGANELVRIEGPGGVRGTAARADIDRVGAGAGVAVRLDDGRAITVERSALAPAGSGVYRLAGAERADARGGLVVPVIEEEAEVGTRAVDRGGVRVRVEAGEREEAVEVPLERRDVRVERVRIGREVEGPMPAREEDGVLVFPVVEEEVVVRKRWVLREEVRVRVERTTTRARESVRLRTESAVVERLAGREGEDGGEATRDDRRAGRGVAAPPGNAEGTSEETQARRAER